MIPYTVPQLELPVILNFLRAFSSSSWYHGEEIRELENEYSRFVGVKHAVVFASGRYALYLLFKYFGISNKKVIVPAYTCIPAADAFRWAGAEPFFLDVDLETYNPKYDLCLQREKNIGAVCLSYLYGLVKDPSPFIKFARSANIPIIEDAAIALGARVHNKMVGSIGDAAVFSLQSSKIITAWRGGVVTTDNSGLYEFLIDHQAKQTVPSSTKVLMNGCIMAIQRLLANSYIYGLTMYPVRKAALNPWIARSLEKFLDQNPSEAVMGCSSKNLPPVEKCCFTKPQARLVLASMDKLTQILALRRKYAAYLTDGLKDIPGIKIPGCERGIDHAYGRFPIRIKGLHKIQASKVFSRHGVEIGLNYPYIIPDTQYFVGYNNNGDRDFPNSRKASKETFLLPFHTFLHKRDLDHMITTVHKVAEATHEGKN